MTLRGQQSDILTSRELQALRLLGTLTAAEMSEVMCVSIKTVEAHKAHLYRKLGVTRDAHAIWEGLRRGLLEPPASEHKAPDSIRRAWDNEGFAK